MWREQDSGSRQGMGAAMGVVMGVALVVNKVARRTIKSDKVMATSVSKTRGSENQC